MIITTTFCGILTLAGFLTIIVWTQMWSLSNAINETLPGFAVSILVFMISNVYKKQFISEAK